MDNISFTVEQGSIFAFLGPNGAGKSTTINALCTILDKTHGELKINGNDVTSRKDKVRNDIGIVFQETTLDGKLTVEENLRLHCDFYNVPRTEVKERIDFVLGPRGYVKPQEIPGEQSIRRHEKAGRNSKGTCPFPESSFSG